MPDKIHTVSEISREIRSALEGNFRGVWVEGEVSNLRLPASGHQYFTLKDAGSQISCVMFRAAAQRNRIALQDGVKIQVLGNISVYEARGQYQLVVQVAQTTGHGQLQAQFEALKKKLHDEGLFDPEKKKPIPLFPKTIAVVTSPSGAAIQDILKVMSRRAPWVRLIIVPVKVQGDGAGGEIARAIQYISKRPRDLPTIDTLIVARGGGSIEDLWSFNEEEVARAIFACPIPVVSGVGHEIDFTISDFVADRREPTPSAAVEASVPDGKALHHRIDVLATRLHGAVESQLRHRRQSMTSLRRELAAREPARKIENWAQSMDYLEERLERAVARQLESNTFKLDRIAAILSGWNPGRDINRARENAERVFTLLSEVLERRLQAKREQLEHSQHLLKAISPDKTLKRGFSMTLDEGGNPVFDADSLEDGQLITTRFVGSQVKSRVSK